MSHPPDTRLETDIDDGMPVVPSPGLLWRSLRVWIWIVVATLSLAAIPDLFVDYWFFESIGHADVFLTTFGVQLALFAVTWVIFCLADYLPIRQYAVSLELRNAAIHLGSWSGLLAGWLVAGHWQTFLLWRHAQPFGDMDPVFGLDVGFYVFTLPALSALVAVLAAAGLDTAVAFLLGRFDQVRSYGLLARRDLSLWDKVGLMVTPGLNAALGAMGASLVGATFLSRYYLLVKSDDTSGVRSGASYLDIEGLLSTVNLINVSIVVEIGLMASVGVALARIARHYAPLVDTAPTTARDIARPAGRPQVALPVRLAATVIAVDLAFFAGVVVRDHVFVRPNEPSIQLPYIQRHMEATLRAYKLDRVDVVDWRPPATTLAAADIASSLTVRNAPILPSWVSRLEAPPDVQHLRRITLSQDLTVYGPTLEVFRQEQTLRPYYDLLSVDGVRYTVDGVRRMFASAVRELPSRAFLGPKEWLRYWGSAALMYTHGYGLVMAPVDRVDDEGRPAYAVSGIPGTTPHVEFASVEPRIYYGEGMKDDYVLTNVRHLEELDYADEQFRVTGAFPDGLGAGIPVDSVWKRLMLAAHTKDATAFLFSSFIDHQRTRVHLYRTPMRRAARIAPFLFIDSNNLAFIADGRIQWMVNALTTTDMYPYSFREVLGDKADERAIEAYPERIVNYAEDAVKITVDAFDGSVRFYRMADDPIVRAWSRAFPALFEGRDAMPAAVGEQLNYPLQWFHLQFDDIYKRYHMRHPLEFYNVEDLWDDADEVMGSLGRGLEEYGTTDEMTFSYEGFNALIDPSDLPAGVDGLQGGVLEYAMLMPFTPEGGRHLRSLVMALQDAESYGRLIDFRVPQGTFIPGPEQADTIIDTDAQVNQQVALWIRHGSEVLRGHTLLLPVKGDLIYIEPLWISSIQNPLPTVKLFSVVYKGRAVMATTLDGALRYLDATEADEQRDNELPWFSADSLGVP